MGAMKHLGFRNAQSWVVCLGGFQPRLGGFGIRFFFNPMIKAKEAEGCSKRERLGMRLVAGILRGVMILWLSGWQCRLKFTGFPPTQTGKFSVPKSSAYQYVGPTAAVLQDPTNGYCTCNMTTLAAYNNRTNRTAVGPPVTFIKDGMSTFYVEVVIGGRKTSDPYAGCQCNASLGNRDTSDACMCHLATAKIPYIYNNSFIPYYTALVSMKKGGIIYDGTFIRYNFDGNGIGCVGCSQDNCWGVPYKNLENWLKMGSTTKQVIDGKTCAISGALTTDANQPFCDYPQSDTQISQCSLKVYIAWVGTDGYGRNMQTSNMMFSKFSQMGVSSMAWQFYTGAANLVTDVSSRVSRRVLGEEAGGRLAKSIRTWFRV